MSWTKLELVQKSFSEIGYAHYSFDLQPEQYQEALEIMDTMLSEWYKLGIDLSYPIPTSPGDSSLSEDSSITDAASAIYSNLALRIAPGKGKTVSAETKRLARTSYNTLIMEAAKSSLMNFPGNMPKGAGYKSWRAGQDPFYDETTQGSSSTGGSRLSSASFTSNGDLLQGSGSSQFRVLKNKIDGSSAPTVTDDADAGYSVSSIWIDVSADKAYLCVDSTAGAAVWIETTAGATAGFTGPSTSTDNAIVRFDGTDGDTGQNSSATIDDNGSINIPSGQAYKINGTALAASDVGAAPTANGVTNGDSHDHSGGDGAQIAYSSLGSIPSTFSPSSHNNTSHSETYITSAGVTKENLATNGDVETTITDTDDKLPTSGAVIDHTSAPDQNAQTGTSYELVLADRGKLITQSNVSDSTITIPANASVAFPVKTVINFLNIGAGTLTIAITSDTLNEADSQFKLETGRAAYIYKTASTVWWMVGGTSA